MTIATRDVILSDVLDQKIRATAIKAWDNKTFVTVNIPGIRMLRFGWIDAQTFVVCGRHQGKSYELATMVADGDPDSCGWLRLVEAALIWVAERV